MFDKMTILWYNYIRLKGSSLIYIPTTQVVILGIYKYIKVLARPLRINVLKGLLLSFKNKGWRNEYE